MWKPDTQTHVRLCLFGFVALLLAGAAASAHIRWPDRPTRFLPTEEHSAKARTAQPATGDAAIVRELEALQTRDSTSVPWRRVTAFLEHPSWDVAGAALDVLRKYNHAGRVAAEIRLIERAIDSEWGRDHASQSPIAPIACGRVVRHVLAQMGPPQHDRSCDVLAAVAQRCPDGLSRARAIELLAARPPRDWQRLVVHALDDPSERTQLAALAIIERERWPVATSRAEPLADSARPLVRARAAEVLAALGRRVNAREYSDAVRRAAGRVSERLDAAGVDFRDVFAPHRLPDAGGFDRESLQRGAEDYLDRSVARADASRDFQGILFLALALRKGQQRLVLRLWEHEVARTDSDDELVDRGLETLARNRLLVALSACRVSDRTAALRELAAMSDVARVASPSSPAHVYARQAAELSAAIWQGSVTPPAPVPQHVSGPASAATLAARRILGDLDVNDAAHRDELLLRLDAWCGLAAPAPAHGTHPKLMAN